MKAMKLKLYPTIKQLDLIRLNVNNARYVYNHYLSLRIDLYKETQDSMSRFDMNTHMTNLKEEKIWLKASHSQTLQDSIKRLDTAFQNFFRRVKNGQGLGFPRFKSKYDSKHSVSYPQGVRFNDNHSKIFIPKIGYVKVRGYRNNLIGDIRTVTVTLHDDDYCTISVLIDNKNQVSKNTGMSAVGIDVGVKKLITDSNGVKILPLNIDKYLKRITTLQVVFSKTTKGSNNRLRVKRRINKGYRKLANARINHLHHIVNNYVHYKVVFVEKLNIKEMTMNTVGTVDNPNNDSVRKTNLNNKIQQQSWGMMFDLLEYKLKDRNSILFKVSPEYTSQICSKCGNIDKKSRNKEHYKCVTCGYEIDADHNAAVNILNRGFMHIPSLKQA